ncbi:carboxypeptidase-like regulatory domain-containing protein [Oleiharenicola lentus]|uniref:carboxypeptidase-like regulatory domain-containing protein n=1 Tax=Oleiharenicola lentus TaxID=2508720 RepID=UPI003F66C5AD
MLALTLSAFAQPTGTITGHVFNTVNKEFVRDAEVRVEGTNISAVSEGGGYFNLARVPAGEVTVTVNYAGLAPASVKLTVNAGEAIAHEFELSGATATNSDPSVVSLETFRVTASLDGGAKALQNQRNSMNMSRSVSSDAFGNVTEGNVGEFLKYLPGVEMEYSEADTRGPRIGGMSSEYASVTLDGKGVASADAFSQYTGYENSAAGTANRSFGFDTISINSIESIEINRVTPASMNADAPAGNINLRSRKAFDQKGRRIGFNFGTVLNSEEFTLNKTPGPDDSVSRKFRPNYSLNYSDVFLNNRLGVVLSVQESNVYVEQYRVDHTYNRTQVAGLDTRPQVLTSVLLKDGPKWTQRATYTGTFDFRVTSNLSVSLTALFAKYHAEFYNRQVTMQAATNNVVTTTGRQFVTGDGVLSYGTGGATAATNAIIFGGGNGQKFTNTLTLTPSFEYRRRNLTIDGAYSSSHSRNDYDNLSHGTLNSNVVNNLTGIGFTATRSSSEDADWKITQTGGPDWTNLSLQTNPRISDDNRQNTIDLKTGELNAKFVLPTRLPTFLQAGLKRIRNYQTATDTRSYDVWQFVGPGGGTTGSFANYPTPFSLYQGNNQPGVKFTSLSGGGAPPFANRDQLGALFLSNPEYFVRSLPTSSTVAGSSGMTLAGYESGRYTNVPTYDAVESISAGYLMANSRIKNLRLQGGLRYELTELAANELDPYSNQDVAAAGYPMTVPVAPALTGVPNSVSAIDYKYSKPRVTRHGEYHDYFPSATAKYSIWPNLLADLGWGKTIKRPNLRDITGVRNINEDALLVTTPNPNLLPERSQKIAASLAYYFGKAGINNAQIVASRTKTKNQTLGNQRISEEEFGNDDPNLAGYEFLSLSNANSPVTWNSMEYSYTQYLSFLPRVLQGTSVNLSYTRTYVETSDPTIFVSGVIPHSIKGTLGWRYGRFNLSFSGIWQDDSGPFLNNLNRYQLENIKYDLSGAVKITKNLSLYFAGRNILEESHRIMEKSAGNPDLLYRYENYGTIWSFGLRGNF